MGCWSATPVLCYLQSSMFKSKKDFYPNWCSNNSSETERGCHAVCQLHVYKKVVYKRSLKVVLTINLMENSLLIKIIYFLKYLSSTGKLQNIWKHLDSLMLTPVLLQIEVIHLLTASVRRQRQEELRYLQQSHLHTYFRESLFLTIRSV